MSLIRNEQTKLTANFLNGMAIALFAVGGLAPTISALNANGGPSWFTVFVSLVCFLAAGGLHYLGRLVLRGLQP